MDIANDYRSAMAKEDTVVRRLGLILGGFPAAVGWWGNALSTIVIIYSLFTKQEATFVVALVVKSASMVLILFGSATRFILAGGSSAQLSGKDASVQAAGFTVFYLANCVITYVIWRQSESDIPAAAWIYLGLSSVNTVLHFNGTVRAFARHIVQTSATRTDQG